MKLKTKASEFFLKIHPEYPDTVSACYFEDDEFEMGELYTVIQRGLLWWKSYAIAYYIADTAAGGINSGGWWNDVRSGFKTKKEALEVLYKGDFKTR